jgi:hypothetical protein
MVVVDRVVNHVVEVDRKTSNGIAVSVSTTLAALIITRSSMFRNPNQPPFGPPGPVCMICYKFLDSHWKCKNPNCPNYRIGWKR